MKSNSQATLKSIAEEVGVSISTVSRVLSGQASRYRISAATEKAILSAAESLSFCPNPIARSLKLNKTYTIGLLIPDIANPFFASIAQSIEREARKFQYSIILCDSEENHEREVESIELLKNRKVDGLIVSPVGRESKHLVRIYESGIPMVTVDRYFPNSNLPFVSSDNFDGALKATNYLISNGHRTIAFIQGLPGTSPNNDRIRGYREAHLQNNIIIDETLIVGDSFGEQNGYVETKLLLRRTVRPTAIFAISNLISLGALRAINEEKMNVPENISLISFDDQPYSDYLQTPMTTVSQQNEEMGIVATKLLFDLIKTKDRSKPKSLLLPTKLIIRKSVKDILPIGSNESRST